MSRALRGLSKAPWGLGIRGSPFRSSYLERAPVRAELGQGFMRNDHVLDHGSVLEDPACPLGQAAISDSKFNTMKRARIVHSQVSPTYWGRKHEVWPAPRLHTTFIPAVSSTLSLRCVVHHGHRSRANLHLFPDSIECRA